jgi:thiamine pyrophosphokinase
LGDMDSLSKPELLASVPSEKIIRYPEDKDYTDTELAVREARRKGVTQLVLIGGGGGRLDHLMAILCLYEREYFPKIWLTATAEVVMIDSEWERKGIRGSCISFFAVGDTTCRMKSRGLRWPLDGLLWKRGDAGISNIVTQDTVKIKMISGKILMVRNFGDLE